MHMLTASGDKQLLARGLEFNDHLQILLARHDTIASSSLMPTQVTSLNPKPTEGRSIGKLTEEGDSSPTCNTSTTVPVVNVTMGQIDEDDDKEDDFAMLARRHSKTQSTPSQSTHGTSGGLALVN